MSTLQGEVYEALRAIEVPEAQAIKAAEALSRRDVDVIDLKRDMTLLKWMVTTNIAMTVAVLFKLLTASSS